MLPFIGRKYHHMPINLSLHYLTNFFAHDTNLTKIEDFPRKKAIFARLTRSIEELNGEVARKLRGNFLYETDHKIDFVALLPHSAVSHIIRPCSCKELSVCVFFSGFPPLPTRRIRFPRSGWVPRGCPSSSSPWCSGSWASSSHS